MNVYRQTREEDILLAGWWHRMDEDGDLGRTFAEGSRGMNELFRLMAPPHVLLYEYDEQGIWLALWLEQVLAGAFAGMWMRSDCRRASRRKFFALLDLFDFALTAVPVIIGVTKQTQLDRGHVRLGYDRLGTIPKLFDGQDATVWTLTREGLERTKKRYRRVLAEDRVMA